MITTKCIKMRHTFRNRPENLELSLLVVLDMSVDEPADHGIEQDDKGHSQGRDEEPHLASIGLSLGHIVAEEANDIENNESTQAHGCIKSGMAQILEDIDEDLVC